MKNKGDALKKQSTRGEKIMTIKQTMQGMKQRLTHRYHALMVSLFMATPAHAGTGEVTAISDALEYVADILTGTAARWTGIIAIACLGIASLVGMLKFMKALSIAVGIGLILGSPQIIDAIGNW